MKKLFLIFIICFFSIGCYAQYMVYTPYGGSNFYMPVHYGASNQLTHSKYNFTVVYANGSQKQVKGKITYDKKTDRYYIKSGKSKIYCNDTKHIYRIDKDSNDTIKGFFDNKMWLFPVIDGEIKGYSIYASNQKSYLTHIKKTNSQVMEYDRKFLKHEFGSFIIDDSESYDLYLKDRKRRRFRTIAPPVIFAACITTSILAPSESALMIVSWIGAPVLPFTPFFVKRISPIKIIETYNENKTDKK